MKSNFIKSIFLTFFSLCFLSVGIMTIGASFKTSTLNAETSVVEDLENNTPEYLGINEYSPEGTLDLGSLINDDIFLYYQNSSNTSNSLKLSLITNGATVNPDGADVYQYVYYPDENNLSVFYFYQITNTNLFINGVAQPDSLTGKNFVTNSNQFFENESGINLETYEVNFSNNKSDKKTISLVDDDGNLIEGRYTLETQIVLYTCTSGRTDGSEESGSFSSDTVTLRYSFIVLNRNDYIVNSRPVVTASNFDNSVNVPTSVSANYGNYYYSNYSYEGNKIASISYNPNKYDVTITKDLNQDSKTETLSYIAEKDISDTENGMEILGDEVVTYVKNDDTVTLYFQNVGNYSVTFNAVATFEYTDENGTINNKYNLSALSNATKKVMVYVYGYQATYVDYDNNKEYTEFKSYENNGIFDGNYYSSADITADFLSSNSSFGQNTSVNDDTGNTTFTINNVLNYINGSNSSHTLLKPVKTNQAPVRFNSNATLANGTIKSYIYSTTKVNSSYQETSLKLGTSTLYRSNYTGGSISDKGTYIYIIAYTFNNFYTSDAQRASSIIFYQTFFFEITGEPPVISLTVNGNEVYSNTFVNQDVTLSNPNLNNDYIHNKDVTVQIYAQDYTAGPNVYLAEYGGENGINMLDAPGFSGGNTLVLKENAHYTIRLYYTNEITTGSTNINTVNNKIKRQYYFTIDKQEISGVNARTASIISGSSRYSILKDLEGISTNQNIVVSWDEKDSGATTYAYYRYFPIVQEQFYNGTDDSRYLLNYLRLNGSNSYLPINYALDFTTDDNNWLRYDGNTKDFASTVNSNYVLSSMGLYVFDIYDEAGNHTVEIYIIDTTSPIFALQTGDTYSLIPGSFYISETSTLYWADYKSILIKNMNTLEFNQSIDYDAITAEQLDQYDLYKDYEGNTSVDLFKEFLQLVRGNDIQYLNNQYSSPSINKFLTMEINDVTYQTPIGSDDYQKISGTNSIELNADIEYIYRVLIRDESNTKYDYASGTEEFIQYASYYSARQNIIVSHDTSKFEVYYETTQNGETQQEVLNSNNRVEGVDSEGGRTLTTYLTPIKVEKPIYISYIPTVIDETTVQIDTVVVEFYEYKQQSYLDEETGITHYYYALSNEVTSTTTLYSYDEDESNTSEEVQGLMINADDITTAGKYVITRTYKTGENFSVNEKDYKTRTFVLIVDRNEVISNPTTVKDENNRSHSESLVGGEIFVGMYDSGENASLVVSYPNSVNGNSDSTTLYNSNNSINSILTTNKLPVNIYVPTYKYTIYSKINTNDTDSSYDFSVTDNTSNNIYYETDGTKTYIEEYLIFAEIYKDYQNESSLPLYRTTKTYSSPDPSNAESKNGFLTFYDVNGNEMQALTTEGVYTVKIFQAYNSVGLEDTTFKQMAMFTFTITSSTPDFTARTTGGKALNYETQSLVANNGETINQVYYTNQDIIQLLWDKPRDTYTAEIDQDHIEISINGGTTTITNATSLFASSPETTGNSYLGTLNLRTLENGFYKNGNYVDITMQYKNHNSYYQKVTKRIVIDTQAPFINIENLVNKVISNTYTKDLITYDDLRIRQNISAGTVTNNQETTYNTSSISGTYRYFAYGVDMSFVDTLKNTAATESANVYYREFNDKYTNSSNRFETNPNDFLETNFNKLKGSGDVSSETLKTNTYYEIVESDLAGNLTIYTIYIMDYASTDDAIIDYSIDGTEQAFTRQDYNDVLNTPNHTPLLGIYSKTGLVIDNLNYFGNAWTPFSVTTTNADGLRGTSYYLTSPWLSQGIIYRVDGDSYVEVNINSIIDGSINSQNKSVITIYDATRGTTVNFYINTRNTNLSASTTTEQSREYISFNQPTDAQLESTTTAYTYLTNLRIYTPASQTTGQTETVYYEQANKTGYADLWAATTNANVNVYAEGGRIYFELNETLNLADNTRIVYEYTDNYGTTLKEIHLYHETTGYQEISSINTLYSFYDTDNTLYYITKDGFNYTYNTRKYSILHYQMNPNDKEYYLIDDNSDVTVTPLTSGSIITNRYTSKTAENYSIRLKIEVYDIAAEEINPKPVKTIYFILNNEIPTPASNMTAVNNGFYFASNGENVTESILGLNGSQKVDYYSKITLYYSTNTTFIPVKFYISTDKSSWEEVANGTQITCPEDLTSQTYYLKIWYDMDFIRDKGYIDQTGNYNYIFENYPENEIYEFTVSSTLSTAYYVTVTDEDGNSKVVEKSGKTYKSNTGFQHANHYIVNINYIDRNSRLQIVTNAEQYISAVEQRDFYQDAENVRTYVYRVSNLTALAENNITNIPKFDTTIAITFIEPTDQFVSEFYTFNSAGIIDRNNNLITSSSLDFVVPDTSSLSQLKLQWSKYYAIEQNTISIKISKNGYELNPTIYSETYDGREYYYTYITRSGRYKISLVDASGNVQIFNKGNASQTDAFTLTFLKDIPFSLTYTNPLTNELETTEPINEAVYNGTVTLALDNETSSYYTAEGVSIRVTRNGVDYTGFTHENSNYTFTETGYYGVTFSAISSVDNSNIKTQTYHFTILNPNEYRYSYIINKYSNYYIERIAKDDINNDVTEIFLDTLDLATIFVNQKEYLAELTLSYLDEKTGAGAYYITINSNEKLYNSENTKTSWTFKVIIQVGSANLIYTSINAGEATTDPITVTFNAANIYNEFGESTLRVIYYNNNTMYTDYTYNITAETQDVQTYTIDNTNVYFVQLVSPSGNLLYSIKLTKNEPFNAATIIAIVVAVLVVIIVIILIIKLRKRIAVK